MNGPSGMAGRDRISRRAVAAALTRIRTASGIRRTAGVALPAEGVIPMSERTRTVEEPKPKFAVRISRGLVTHWLDHPLTTWEQANEARKAILDYMGEEGEIEEVLLCE